MGIVDVVLMALIIGGALSLLYRSVWKKQGHCSGCGPGSCVKTGCAVQLPFRRDT